MTRKKPPGRPRGPAPATEPAPEPPGPLVHDWRSSWRWLSMQLAAVASLALTALLWAPEILLQALGLLPDELRAIFPPFVGLGLFVLVAAARLWRQRPRKPK